MIFETLNTITEDLLKIIRGSKISSSETISKRQIENWVHQYRALLLKQDVDKGKYLNPDYIQELPFLTLEQVSTEGNGIDVAFNYTFDFVLVEGDRQTGTGYLLKTVLPIPKTIDFNYKYGFTYIGTVDGTEIQLIPEHRYKWKTYKRWGGSEINAFYKIDRHIYLTNDNPELEYITIRGIFENPAEVERFLNPNLEVPSFNINSRYPIPTNKVPLLKEMILKNELGIESTKPSDNKNDSANGLSNNNQID